MSTETTASISTITNDGDVKISIDYEDVMNRANVKRGEGSSNNTKRMANVGQEDEEELSVCCAIFLILFVGTITGSLGLLWSVLGWTYGLPACCAAVVVLLLITPGWRWFYIAAVTSRRDITYISIYKVRSGQQQAVHVSSMILIPHSALIAYINLLIFVRRYERKNINIGDIFEINVAKHPDQMAIISETQRWTFRQLNEYANRVANVFHNHGYKKGDVVGLLMENRAEFVGTWLGLSKIGVVTSLINTNLRGPSLLHSISVGQCIALIYTEAYTDALLAITNELASNLALYQFNENKSTKKLIGLAKDLSKLLETAAKHKVTNGANRPDHHDKLIYIYTSGTTGLPKAAVISHSRYFFITAGIHYTLNFCDQDIFYTPLPLYHTAGGVMSIGQSLLFGSTVVIRKKFSASGYFTDCAKFNCTIAQYIGEMARYILATKPSEYDRKHKVRMVFGNGLRPHIWPQFVERFKIANVGEFYGATEGNANIMNNDNTVGAIGFISRVLPQVYPISIIRANPDTGEPIRNSYGLCQRCKPNEPGVFIGKIVKGNPTREFLGYVDSKASSKKIVQNVFDKGDMAFISGDLLVSDERGYLYFKDRTGDTFRWKGENVSTSEVEAQVSNVAGYKDAIVYGVTIPNTEGRAGMAAIYDPEKEVNLHEFAESLTKSLPVYAKPQFLRFLQKIHLTGTFKLRKVELQKQGYDPRIINDELYYLTSAGNYEKLTVDVYDKIYNGELRF